MTQTKNLQQFLTMMLLLFVSFSLSAQHPLSGKSFYIKNTYGDPSHEWYGALLSWDDADPNPEGTVDKDDPVKWRFDAIAGKANTYRITNTFQGKWNGADLSWSSTSRGPMIRLNPKDPVEWRMDAVAGKANTYKIVSTYPGQWDGASISWEEEGSKLMASVEFNDPVEWELTTELPSKHPLAGKAFYIKNTHGGRSHEWYGALLSWNPGNPNPEGTVEKDDPVKWRFEAVAGKTNTYLIKNTFQGKWNGADLSWDGSTPDHPMIRVALKDPVEWRMDPVAGKPNTYKIVSTYSGKWDGASLSWDPGKAYLSASLEHNDPVEWELTETIPKLALKGGSGTQGGNTWANNATPTGAAKPGNPIKASGTAPTAGASYAGSYPQLDLLFKVLDKARQNNKTVLFDGALLGPFDLLQDAVSSFTYPNVENVEVSFSDGRAGFYGKAGSQILPQYKLSESAIKTLGQKGMDAADVAKLTADSNIKDKSYSGSGPLDWDGAQTAFLDAVKASIGDAAMTQNRDNLLSFGLEGALSEPEDAVLSIKGQVKQFWGEDFDIELKFFNMTDAKASKPAPKFEIRLTSPAAAMANPTPTKLSDHGVDVPLGDVEVYGPTIVVTNASTVYDKSFDSGINEGFNFFGNIYLSKPGKNNTDNQVLLSLGKMMDADEMAVHFAVDNSGATKKGLLELGFTSQRAIYPLSDDYVDGADSKVKWRDTNHKFTAKIVRSDLTFEKEAASITLGGGTDFQISIKDLTSDEKTVLIFTGGLSTDFKSLTGSLTLNGTGRSTTGELSGATHNTSEWKEPFGIPGLTVRQAAFQIGVNPSGIDNIGVMGNLKIDNVDGSFAALADVTSPDQFVAAGSVLDISLLQLASGMFMGPAGMAAYQKAIPSAIRQGAEEVLQARLKDFNFSVVPNATSIGGIHFRQEGIVGHGVLDLWGWESYGELQFDYKDGLKMEAYMDDVEWNVKGVKVFQLEKSKRDAGKSTMDKVYYDTGVKTFRTKTINLGNRPYFKFELGIPQPGGGDVKLMGKASANIYLLGLTADTYMDLTNEGLKFNLDMNAFNTLKGGLAVTVGDGKFVGRGNIGYSVGDVYIPSFRATDIPGMPSFPFIDRVRLPSITLPTASSAKIDTEIRAATTGSFGLELHNGHFQWQSYRIDIPNFSVDSPPLGVDKIPGMVKSEITGKAKDLFSDYYKKEGERMAKRFLDIANKAAKKAKEAAEAAKKAAEAAKKAAEETAKKAAEAAKKAAEETAKKAAEAAKRAADEARRRAQDALEKTKRTARKACFWC